QLIGPILSWKLTGMLFLMMFAMIIVSSIIISMTTLYYSYDLKFLFSCPVSRRAVFMDKAADTVVFSSWTLVVAFMPFVLALLHVKNLSLGFMGTYLLLMVPFVMLAAACGIFFSLIIMYVFPSSRTRDITWVLGSLSVAFVYVMFRFAEPEKLLRPDSMQVIAQYIEFLQAPTAPYLPSWWATKAMMAFSSGNWAVFAKFTALLTGTAAAVYAFMAWICDFFYMKGFNGAQGSPRFKGKRNKFAEQKILGVFPKLAIPLSLYWKDRLALIRDAKYWSQIILIFALIAVYLFSIKQLPLDTPAVKNFICFLNITAAGFVVAAIGLRFTFPAISMEGGGWQIMRSSPINIQTIMREKLFISLPPAALIGLVLITVSNHILEADTFVSVLSSVSILFISFGITAMGIGFGGIFPDFRTENIHKLESSYGGFFYMVAAMAYLGLIVACEAWPVQVHYLGGFSGVMTRWKLFCIISSSAGFMIVNLLAVTIPWKLAVKNLSRHENF
ncbi:MAG: hypothetical protein J5706_05045, partial [Elusimicrobiales bacterium]|nr:hypothetical protein [Elusimicrobiales bacterium]